MLSCGDGRLQLHPQPRSGGIISTLLAFFLVPQPHPQPPFFSPTAEVVDDWFSGSTTGLHETLQSLSNGSHRQGLHRQMSAAAVTSFRRLSLSLGSTSCESVCFICSSQRLGSSAMARVRAEDAVSNSTAKSSETTPL